MRTTKRARERKFAQSKVSERARPARPPAGASALRSFRREATRRRQFVAFSVSVRLVAHHAPPGRRAAQHAFARRREKKKSQARSFGARPPALGARARSAPATHARCFAFALSRTCLPRHICLLARARPRREQESDDLSEAERARRTHRACTHARTHASSTSEHHTVSNAQQTDSQISTRTTRKLSKKRDSTGVVFCVTLCTRDTNLNNDESLHKYFFAF